MQRLMAEYADCRDRMDCRFRLEEQRMTSWLLQSDVLQSWCSSNDGSLRHTSQCFRGRRPFLDCRGTGVRDCQQSRRPHLHHHHERTPTEGEKLRSGPMREGQEVAADLDSPTMIEDLSPREAHHRRHQPSSWSFSLATPFPGVFLVLLGRLLLVVSLAAHAALGQVALPENQTGHSILSATVSESATSSSSCRRHCPILLTATGNEALVAPGLPACHRPAVVGPVRGQSVAPSGNLVRMIPESEIGSGDCA